MSETFFMLLAGAVLIVGLVALGVFAFLNLQRQREQESAELAELKRLQAETMGRLTMLAGGQAELQRAVHERLDSVTHHLGQSMTATRQHTSESLARLNAPIAVIRAAQT